MQCNCDVIFFSLRGSGFLLRLIVVHDEFEVSCAVAELSSVLLQYVDHENVRWQFYRSFARKEIDQVLGIFASTCWGASSYSKWLGSKANKALTKFFLLLDADTLCCFCQLNTTAV